MSGKSAFAAIVLLGFLIAFHGSAVNRHCCVHVFTSVHLADSCFAFIAEGSAFISPDGNIIASPKNNLSFCFWHCC